MPQDNKENNMSDAQAPASAAPEASPASGEISNESLDLSPEEAQAEAEASSKEEIKALKKKYSLKVNNKEKDIELDLNDDAEVSRYLQKAMAADEKFQEASSLRKQVEQLIGELKKNPLAILRHPELGIDVKMLAQQVLNEELEEMELSPEQKKIKELEAALKGKEEREKALEEERSAAERAKFEEQAMSELDEQITGALSKSSLPKSQYVVRRIADTMLAAMEMGHKEVTPEQIMPFVEEQILGEIQRLFESAPEDTFDKVMEGVIGKKHLDKYRKSKVSKSRAKVPVDTASQVKDTGNAAKPKQENKDAKPVRFKDLFKT